MKTKEQLSKEQIQSLVAARNIQGCLYYYFILSTPEHFYRGLPAAKLCTILTADEELLFEVVVLEECLKEQIPPIEAAFILNNLFFVNEDSIKNKEELLNIFREVGRKYIKELRGEITADELLQFIKSNNTADLDRILDWYCVYKENKIALNDILQKMQDPLFLKKITSRI